MLSAVAQRRSASAPLLPAAAPATVDAAPLSPPPVVVQNPAQVQQGMVYPGAPSFGTGAAAWVTAPPPLPIAHAPSMLPPPLPPSAPRQLPPLPPPPPPAYGYPYIPPVYTPALGAATAAPSAPYPTADDHGGVSYIGGVFPAPRRF